MMKEPDAVVLPDEAEMAAGFSAQTLIYSDSYELPKLGDGRNQRLERAVALEVDAGNRIKRCRGSGGYVHEVLDGEKWLESGKFESLAEVLGSDIYNDYLRKEREKSGEPEQCD